MKHSNHQQAWYVVNGITWYRIIAAPVLLVLLVTGHYSIFKYLLGISFFTDLIDGFLARKYKVVSSMGSRLDSIGDDLTVLVAMIALFVRQAAFIKQQVVLFSILLSLFFIQAIYAFIRYGKITSFHTYLAKSAALLQGLFFIFFFFTDIPTLWLFYTAAIVTILELTEEIILVAILRDWQTNVKGIYWVLKKKNSMSEIS